jgi:hypothetical protein
MIEEINTSWKEKKEITLDFSKITSNDINKSFGVIYTKNEGTTYSVHPFMRYKGKELVIGSFCVFVDKKWYSFQKQFEVEFYFPFEYAESLNNGMVSQALNKDFKTSTILPTKVREMLKEQLNQKISSIISYKEKGIASFLEYMFLDGVVASDFPDTKQIRKRMNSEGDQRKYQLSTLGVYGNITLSDYLSKFKTYCDRKGFTYNPENIIRLEMKNENR